MAKPLVLGKAEQLDLVKEQERDSLLDLGMAEQLEQVLEELVKL